MVATAFLENSDSAGINGPQNDDGALTGAAYVFVRDGDSWVQQAFLKAASPDNADNFGFSCDIDGDTIVIGSRSEDSSAAGVNGDQLDNGLFNSGAAYVFVRNGTTWTQQAFLKASNPGFQDAFGIAVAIDGDTLVVGAPSEDSGAQGVNGDQNNNAVGNSGAAYVFVRDGETWTQQAYLKQSNTEPTTANGFADDAFGVGLAICGDTIAVGAPGEDSSATGINGEQFDNNALGSGAVYIFTRNGTTWSQQAYLKGEVVDEQDDFGASLSLDGNTLAVAVPAEDSIFAGVGADPFNNSASRTGAAYVFERDAEDLVWSQQAFFKASNPEENDTFGTGIAIFGDLMVVGATGEDSNAVGINGDQTNNSLLTGGAGAAYLFRRTDSSWNQEAYIKSSNPDLADFFGNDVAFDGNTIIVASAFEDSGSSGVDADQTDESASNAGALYVFELETEFKLGDVNCDGTIDLLDVGPFVDSISSDEFNPKADINLDGTVDLLDVGPFVALLSGG